MITPRPSHGLPSGHARTEIHLYPCLKKWGHLFRRSVEESVARLGIRQIDILYLHGPVLEDLSTEVIDCLYGLKDRGLIRLTGVNTFDRVVLRRVAKVPIDIVMPQYSIFDVTCLNEITSLQMAGKTVISATALGQGIIDFRDLFPTSKKSLWYLLRALKNDPLFPLTRFGARRRMAALGCPPLEAALLFLLETPAIISAVFGTTSISHLEQNAEAVSKIAGNGARV
jgi:aryl-alcohol dehydrogenase-like predicted oxidoreductase